MLMNINKMIEKLKKEILFILILIIGILIHIYSFLFFEKGDKPLNNGQIFEYFQDIVKKKSYIELKYIDLYDVSYFGDCEYHLQLIKRNGELTDTIFIFIGIDSSVVDIISDDYLILSKINHNKSNDLINLVLKKK